MILTSSKNIWRENDHRQEHMESNTYKASKWVSESQKKKKVGRKEEATELNMRNKKLKVDNFETWHSQ